MLVEIFLFLLLGILMGTITGLIPGIHINLITIILIQITTRTYLNPLYSIIFITSLAITHTFTDFIPSIFLGCPDTDTELSVLPGHELLKNKRGYEAIYLSNIGGLTAIIISTFIIVPFILFIPKFFLFIKKFIPFLLILILLTLILSEKRKISSFWVIILTGFLGLSMNSLQLTQPLLPLLTGLFGASNIILSIKNKTTIPEQILTKPSINLKRPILGSLISTPLLSILPGLGSGEATIIANSFIKQSKQEFLVLTGIINTLIMILSILTLYSINKSRTGASVAIEEIFPNLQLPQLILLSFIIILSGFIAYFITDRISKFISKRIQKINYEKISYFVLIILILINFIVCDLIGMMTLIVSTLTGIYCIQQKVRRSNMMGCLLVPTIIWLF